MQGWKRPSGGDRSLDRETLKDKRTTNDIEIMDLSNYSAPCNGLDECKNKWNGSVHSDKERSTRYCTFKKGKVV